jgi:hypothetical protein
MNNADDQGGATVRMGCAPGNRPVIGLEGIIDGTANVILYGEKRLNVRAVGTYQGDDNEGWVSGWDHDVVRTCTLVPLPDPTTGDGQLRFGSSHSASFNVVMCDGAVKNVSFKIESNNNNRRPDDTGGATTAWNQTLFNRLGTRNDKLPGELTN